MEVRDLRAHHLFARGRVEEAQAVVLGRRDGRVALRRGHRGPHVGPNERGQLGGAPVEAHVPVPAARRQRGVTLEDDAGYAGLEMCVSGGRNRRAGGGPFSGRGRGRGRLLLAGLTVCVFGGSDDTCTDYNYIGVHGFVNLLGHLF